MPIPKEKQELYGKVIGHMINLGKSQKAAKDITERAVVSHKNESGKGKVKSDKRNKGKKGQTK